MKQVFLLTVFAALFTLGGRAEEAEAYHLYVDRMRTEVLKQVNEARLKKDLPPLQADKTVTSVAQGMAQRMAIEGKRMGRGNAQLLMTRFGWTHFVENTDETTLFSPRETVSRWLENFSSRDHIYDKSVQLAGVGIQAKKDGRVYVTFNAVRSKNPLPAPEPTASPSPRTPDQPKLR